MPSTTPTSTLSARLRVWSQLWWRHTSGERFTVSGGDAVRALDARRPR